MAGAHGTGRRTRSRWWRRRPMARGVLVACVVCALAGATACQVTTEVAIDVDEGGGGTVAVSVALDDDALSRIPGIESELRLDDLAATGWELDGPDRADGATTFVAVKPFATPAEGAQVLDQLTGPDGPFRDLRLTVDRSFARTEFGFDGTVDLSGGLESFGDAELAVLLDGEPLGADESALEAALGAPLDQAFRFRVELALPGSVSESSGEGDDPVVWEPSLSDGEPTVMRVRATTWRVGTLVLVTVAVLAAAALGALVLRGFAAKGPRQD